MFPIKRLMAADTNNMGTSSNLFHETLTKRTFLESVKILYRIREYTDGSRSFPLTFLEALFSLSNIVFILLVHSPNY